MKLKDPCRPRSLRGLTLLETMLAMMVTFVTLVLLSGTLVSTTQFTEKIQEYSTGVLLAQTQLDQLQIYTPDDIAAGSGTFPNYPGYKYTIGKVPLDAHTMTINLSVKTPSGRSVDLSTIMRNVKLYGIAVAQGEGSVTYVDKPSGSVKVWTPGPVVSPVPLAGVEPVGLGADRELNIAWAGDVLNSVVVDADLADKGVPWAPATNGESEPNPFGRPGGVTVGYDPGTGVPQIWVADRTNHEVFVLYENGLNNYDWKGPIWAPQPAPLGEPLGVALEVNGNNLWIGDLDNMCLRHASYPHSSEPTGGIWDPVQYRPPAAMAMGLPLGVACDPQGGHVFVVDNNNLFILDAPPFSPVNNNPGTWTKIPLDPQIVANYPSGISWDNMQGDYRVPGDPQNAINKAGGYLWVVDEAGHLWRCQPFVSPAFTKML